MRDDGFHRVLRRPSLNGGAQFGLAGRALLVRGQAVVLPEFGPAHGLGERGKQLAIQHGQRKVPVLRPVPWSPAASPHPMATGGASMEP